MGEAVGPFKERGDPAGIVIRHGYIVAEWARRTAQSRELPPGDR